MKDKGTGKSGAGAPDMTRKLFRLPIDAKNTIELTIDAVHYEVINVAENGVGLLLEGDTSFIPGETLDSIHIRLNDETLSLQGKVVHVSPHDFQLLCGIEFIKMTPQDSQKILDFLHRYRSSLFHDERHDLPGSAPG